MGFVNKRAHSKPDVGPFDGGNLFAPGFLRRSGLKIRPLNGGFQAQVGIQPGQMVPRKDPGELLESKNRTNVKERRLRLHGGVISPVRSGTGPPLKLQTGGERSPAWFCLHLN